MKSKKTLTFLLVGVFAIALASGALLNFFGSISGTANVEQAVTLDGESHDSTIEGAWDGDVVAGETFTENHTIKNNADESVNLSIDTECNSEVDSGVQCGGITTGVYEVQGYDLVGHKYGDTEEYDRKDDAVEVVPGVDEVTYRIDFSDDSDEVDLEISREDGEENYHVKYDGDDFKYKDPSNSGDLKDAENLEEFKEGSEDDGVVEITVERETGYEQSFSVHLMGDFDDDADSYVTQTAFDEDDGDGNYFYDDTSEEHHEEIDFEEVSDLTLESGKSFDFSLSNRFAINLEPANYTITSKVA